MNKERMLTILRAPRVSEKASKASGSLRQYVFHVAKDACKPEIALAVKHLFGVEVKNVRVCNVKGKRVRFGRMQGRHSDWKKAYITLKQDQEIDLAGQVGV